MGQKGDSSVKVFLFSKSERYARGTDIYVVDVDVDKEVDSYVDKL